MRFFRLALSVTVLLVACGGTSADGLFDQGGAGGVDPGAGAGSSGVLGAGGSSGVAGSSGSAGALGAAGGQGVGGSAAAAGSEGSGGSSGTLGSGGFGAGGTDGGVIDPGDASPDGSEDASHPCPSGNYSGSLSGPYRSRLGNSTFTARLEFVVNPEGGVLGRITATSNPTGRANFAGRLDCKTGALVIEITEGSYSDALGMLRYTGTMNATYEPSTESFPNGTFAVTETNPMYGGEGTWRGSLASG
jgi:hypothetical protein